MKTIRYEGFEALCTRYVEGSDGLLYLEFAGPLTSARAIAAAATLQETRKHDSGLTIDGRSVHLERFITYRIRSLKAPERKAHGITTQAALVHDALTYLDTNADYIRFLTKSEYPEDRPPKKFFERLTIAMHIPLKPEWESWLWNEGKKEVKFWDEDSFNWRSPRALTPVKKVAGYNVNCWAVSTNKMAWVQVVRNHFDLNVQLRYGKRKDNTEAFYDPDNPVDGWKLNKLNGQWELWRFNQPITTHNKDGKVIPLVAHSDVATAIRAAYVKYGIQLMVKEAA
jgi:hypothetical protein